MVSTLKLNWSMVTRGQQDFNLRMIIVTAFLKKDKKNYCIGNYVSPIEKKPKSDSMYDLCEDKLQHDKVVSKLLSLPRLCFRLDIKQKIK